VTHDSGRVQTIMSLTLSPEWDQASSVRHTVCANVPFASRDLKDAIVMAASELVENAIKHGAHGEEHERATFSMKVENKEVVFEVSNTVSSEEAASKLCARIERIASTPDKRALYMERMTELLMEPDERGGIGLYRIAFEGRFALEVRFVRANVVTIRAARRLQ
jgi:hypothetical protein